MDLLLPPPKKSISKDIRLLPFPPKKPILLGIEYTNLAHPPKKPNKKQRGKIDHAIEKLKGLSDDEAEFVYNGGVGVYLPAFKTYLEQFWDVIKSETKIKADFAAFKNTSIFERYMANAAQFSSAKSVAVNGMMKSALFDEGGVRKGFSKFKADCRGITDIVNDVWLRTEYDTSVKMAVSGDMFRAYREDADLYPYWIYLETTSENPRETHLELVGNVYRIGDPEGDAVFPSSDWNCNCGSEQIDDQYLKENDKSVRTNDEAKEDLENHVNPQFRFNAADSGILPKEGHSYFQALPNANDANGETFGITGNTAQPTKLRAMGMHNMVETIHRLRHEHHSTADTITFQCPKLLTNILWDNKSFHNVAKNSAGFDKLADTVTNPDEVFSYWANPQKQTDVYRNYLKGNYAVTTLNGHIENAWLLDNINSKRKGVLIV